MKDLSKEVDLSTMETTQKWSEFCSDCGNKKRYSEDYDAYYCVSCNKWLENKCSDANNCEYCAYRPPNPPLNEYMH